MTDEGTSKIIRPVRGGQITIPAEFRERLGIGANTLLQITLLQGELRIRPMQVSERTSGSPWVRELYDRFAPVRQETERAGYSGEEVDAAVDEAVKAVRRPNA